MLSPSTLLFTLAPLLSKIFSFLSKLKTNKQTKKSHVYEWKKRNSGVERKEKERRNREIVLISWIVASQNALV